LVIEMAESPEISRPLLWTRAQMSINDKKIRCCGLQNPYYNITDLLTLNSCMKYHSCFFAVAVED